MAAGKELDPVINTNEFAAVAAVAAETHVHSNGGNGTGAKIARFGTSVQGLVRSSTLVRLQDAMQALALGMTGNVKIETEVLKGALAVPIDSIKFDEEGEYVMLKAAGGGEDKRVSIRTGLLQGDQILVTGDLKAGDTVIVFDAKPTESGSPFGGR